MPKVITEQSQVKCIHQGKATTVAGQSRLKVSGAPALVEGDLTSVTLCTNVPPPPGRVACTTITANPGGTATKLKVGGKAVLLEAFTGITNSTPPGTCSVSDAGQSRLAAV